MSRIGLVLGGGGITGAAFEMATLMAVEMATGWEANESEVVVGTSCGAYVAALLRHQRLGLDSLVEPGESRDDVAERISRHVFPRRVGGDPRAWLRHGLLPGFRRPGLTFLLGSPAACTAQGVAGWVRTQVGAAADRWPERPTIVTAFDLASRRRVAFGAPGSPRVGIADAVAASSAIPVVFRPWEVGGRSYVDGGVVSGTHADLLLANRPPLDLIVVLAPMAASEDRRGAWPHERLLDRLGRTALDAEVARVRRTWPQADILVLRPDAEMLSVMRPNPMDPKAALPTFVRTLGGMRRILARAEVWPLLDRHLRAGVGLADRAAV